MKEREKRQMWFLAEKIWSAFKTSICWCKPQTIFIPFEVLSRTHFYFRLEIFNIFPRFRVLITYCSSVFVCLWSLICLLFKIVISNLRRKTQNLIFLIPTFLQYIILFLKSCLNSSFYKDLDATIINSLRLDL